MTSYLIITISIIIIIIINYYDYLLVLLLLLLLLFSKQRGESNVRTPFVCARSSPPPKRSSLYLSHRPRDRQTTTSCQATEGAPLRPDFTPTGPARGWEETLLYVESVRASVALLHPGW